MDFNTLPKAELHCHLDGILSPAMLRDILLTDPTFPVDLDALARAYPVNGLDSFFAWQSHTAALKTRLALHYPIITRHIAHLKAQNVRYFELMVSHGSLPQDDGQAFEAMTAFREHVNTCEAGAIQVEFIFAVGRLRSPERMAASLPLVLRLFEAGLIVGIALAGPEIGNPVKPYAETFRRYHEAGLKIEMHAGEWVGAESVWDALEYGYPDRIGHGVSLFDDPRLIEHFQAGQLHIEMCPTCNLVTGSVQRFEDHPIARAKALGLNFSLNTDDPGIVACSMNSEYQRVTDVFGFTPDDWMQVYHNTLAARFQPDLRVAVA